MRTEAHPGSFRDPAGHVFERDGVLYRVVAPSFETDYQQFVDSGLYDDLVADGLLVAHDEVDPELASAPAHRVLRPERIDFVSFPYEWCPGQLRDAALLTLEIQRRALERGMILRDASAFNVTFRGTDPVLIDTLSLGIRPEEAPWVAYGQFCRHFLAPLALAAYVDVRLLGLLRTHLDGIPLDLCSRLLPLRTRARPGLLMHLHLHARAQGRGGSAGKGGGRKARFSLRSLQGLCEGLRGIVQRLEWDPGGTTWADYYEEADHYSGAAVEVKRAAVAAFVEETRPGRLWDLGANTGQFSRLAADRGVPVLACDADPGAVERAYRDLSASPPADGSVLPLLLDLTNPSPALGWAHEERAALLDRGRADAVLALALVHHLAIGNNVPLPRVVGLVARLGGASLIEFVPKADPKVQEMLATREDVFDDYHEEAFEAAARLHATIVGREPVAGTRRVLYTLRHP